MEGENEPIPDDQILSLQTELDTEKKLNLMKDEKIQEYQQQIQNLKEQIQQLSTSPIQEVAEIESPLFMFYDNILNETEKENIELKSRLLKLLSQKRNLKIKLKQTQVRSVPMSPKSPSSPEVEIKNLNNKIFSLQSDLEFNTEQVALLTEMNQKLQEKYDASKVQIKQLKQEAKSKFEILHTKLQEARNKEPQPQIQEPTENDAKESQANLEIIDNLNKEIEDLKAQNQQTESMNKELQSTIEELQNSLQELQNGQFNFISSLGNILGCNSLQEIVSKVQTLIQVPRTQQYDELIDSLKQIYTNLSPNMLKLPHDSELRQLFAALCNMLNAAIDPKASKSMLIPYIKSVVVQARVFMPGNNHQNAFDENVFVRNEPTIEQPSAKSFK
ncbi:hypothetical protein GPJ56_008838 [Histomonas meleagridis]|uniref:uncharacterized protein n=1 Tax=Histomonas meleagridis TaxID=135588 RepID=UPI00355ABA93|nr:hypothetical protein GPJ56_008838 [Histomonas meleagridis]KAH0805371.1 hypothetical protein GO595_001753 [Histomonas meleagridis]